MLPNRIRFVYVLSFITLYRTTFYRKPHLNHKVVPELLENDTEPIWCLKKSSKSNLDATFVFLKLSNSCEKCEIKICKNHLITICQNVIRLTNSFFILYLFL